MHNDNLIAMELWGLICRKVMKKKIVYHTFNFINLYYIICTCNIALYTYILKDFNPSRNNYFEIPVFTKHDEYLYFGHAVSLSK